MQSKIRNITAKSLSVFIAIILISSVAIPIFGYAKPVSAQTASYTITIDETGLPAGTTWTATVQCVTYFQSYDSTSSSQVFHGVPGAENCSWHASAPNYQSASSGQSNISFNSDQTFNVVFSGNNNSSPPSAPSLTLNGATSNTVSLSWNSVSGATSYTVWRSSSSNGLFSNVSSATAITSTSFTDSNLLSSNTYYYQVTASGPSGTSSPSNTISATTQQSGGGSQSGGNSTSTFTAMQSGNWNDPATWGGLTSPPLTIISGETVMIPAGLTITIPVGVTVTNFGTITNYAGTGTEGIYISGTLVNNGLINDGSSFSANKYGDIVNDAGGIIVNSGTVNINFGLVWNLGGTITNNAGGTVNQSPYGNLETASPLNNYGTINNDQSNILVTPGPTSTLSNSGTINIVTGLLTIGGGCEPGVEPCTLSNSGTINNQGGKINNIGGTINNSGTIADSCGGTFANSGTLIGSLVVNTVCVNQAETVTFTESGLPTGISWAVTLNGNTQSSTSSSMIFSVPDGNYQFSVNPPDAYNVVPYSGSLTVNGSPISQALSFVPPVQESGSTQVSMSLTGQVSGPITNLRMNITSGTITAGGTSYSVTDTSQYSSGVDVIGNSPNGVLSAGFIHLNNNLVLGLASCYQQTGPNQLSLNFYNGRPATCGGSTVITQPPTGPFYCPFNATGTLTVTGSQATITASGTGNCNIPNEVTVPGSTSLTATSSGSQVNLSWNTPTNTGGAPITGYEIQRSISGGPYSTIRLVNASPTGLTDSGLSPGTSYSYIVYAINSAGTGQPSNVASVTIPLPTLEIIGSGTSANPTLVPITTDNCQQPQSSSSTTCPPTYIETTDSYGITNQYFNEYVEVFWNGQNPINAPSQLSQLSTLAPSWSDATITCNLAGSGQIPINQLQSEDVIGNTNVQIAPNQSTWLTYQCKADWNYIDSGTVTQRLGAYAFSSDLSAFETKLGDEIPSSVQVVPSVEVLISVASGLDTLFNHGINLGTSFNVGFLQNQFTPKLNVVYDQTPTVNVLAPPQKFSAFTEWLASLIVAPLIGTGLGIGALATAPLCVTIVGCLVPAAFVIAAIVSGPAINDWTENQIADPSLDYTQFVNVEQPPTTITLLQNTTAGKAVYYAFLYKSYVNATLQSDARATGALLNNSTYYAVLQNTRAEEYANNASIYLTQFKYYLNQTFEEVNSTGEINQIAFDSGKEDLVKNGIPVNLSQILDGFNMEKYLNMTQIENSQFAAINSTDLNMPNFGNNLVLYNKVSMPYIAGHLSEGGPTLIITAPTDNSNSNHNMFNVLGSTNDTSGIQKVMISIDGSQSLPATLNFGAYPNSQVSWSYTTPILTDGSHVLIVNSTANNGLSSLSSVLVTVDTNPPEAYVQFDPLTKGIVLYGTDSLSGIPNNPIIPTSIVPTKWGDDDNKLDNDTDKGDAQIRTYNIADMAGNTLTLTEKIRTSGHEEKIRILSLQYNGGKVISTLPNEAKFNWSENKDHTIKELEQHIAIGKDKDKQDVDAKYSLKDNKTIIQVEIPSKHNQEIKETGMIFLHMATNNGTLIVNGY